MEIYKKNKILINIILACGFIALLVFITIVCMPYIINLKDEAYREQVKAWIDSLGVKGWFVSLGIQVLQVVVAFIPGEPVQILAGMVYGTFGGLILCLVGVLIGTAIIYFLVKAFGRPFVEKAFSKKQLDRFQFLHDTKKLELIIFILFLLPGMPKDLLTYIVPLTDLKASRFFAITSIARIPALIASTYIGRTIYHGNFAVTIGSFILIGIIGICGILYKDKLLDFIKKKR